MIHWPIICVVAFMIPFSVYGALTVKFNEEKSAIYNFNHFISGSLQSLIDGEICILSGTVVLTTGNFRFGLNTLVELKIVRSEVGNCAELTRESAALDYIQRHREEGNSVEGIQLSDGMGVCENLHQVLKGVTDTHYQYTVLVTQALGIHLVDNSAGPPPAFSPEVLGNVIDRLDTLLSQLRTINFAHGYIQPRNVRLNAGNNWMQEIFLTNITHANYSGVNEVPPRPSGGFLMFFVSLPTMITKRPAEWRGDLVSCVYTILVSAGCWLPWESYCQLMKKCDTEDEYGVKYWDQIGYMKAQFHLAQYKGELRKHIDKASYLKLMRMLQLSRLNDEQTEEIKAEVERYRTAVARIPITASVAGIPDYSFGTNTSVTDVPETPGVPDYSEPMRRSREGFSCGCDPFAQK